MRAIVSPWSRLFVLLVVAGGCGARAVAPSGAALGEACQSNGECANGSVCIAGACRSVCTGDVDCARAEACVNGGCVAVDGAECADDDACAAPGACAVGEGAFCLAGLCHYTPRPANYPCDDGDPCTTEACDGSGHCVSAPRACDTPPAPGCLSDDATYETWSPVGRCSDGACTYDATTQACASCRASCLHVCDGVSCAPLENGGCLTGGRCDASVDPVTCAYDTATDGTTCDLTATGAADGRCAGGQCWACIADGDCTSSGDACNAGVCDSSTHTCAKSPANDGATCDLTATGAADGKCAGGQCRACFADADCASLADACNAGVCDPSTHTCRASATNEGATCAADQCGAWSDCAYATACAYSGSQSRSCFHQVCNQGVCGNGTSYSQPQACSRNTDGATCAATTCSYGACSVTTCGVSGTESGTCTPHTCGGGTCNDGASYASSTGCVGSTCSGSGTKCFGSDGSWWYAGMYCDGSTCHSNPCTAP